MTGSGLGRTGISEEQIPNERSKSHSQHDPAIVGHEKKPVRVRGYLRTFLKDLHNEERIKDLHTVESSFHKLASLLLRSN